MKKVLIFFLALLVSCCCGDEDVGIRETSYYAWQNLDMFGPYAGGDYYASYNDIAIDSNGVIYAVGGLADSDGYDWLVRRSQDDGETWETVDIFGSAPPSIAQGIAIDSNDVIYVCGYENTLDWIVRSSSTGDSGSFANVDFVDAGLARGIAIDSNDVIYVVGYVTLAGDAYSHWAVRSSSDGTTGSFGYVDLWTSEEQSCRAHGIAISSSNAVYVVGYEWTTGESTNWAVRSSSDGTTGSFKTIDSYNDNDRADQANGIAINSVSEVYVVGDYSPSAGGYNDWAVRSSSDGASGSFGTIDVVTGYAARNAAQAVAIDSNDTVYVVGGKVTGSNQESHWVVRRSYEGTTGSFEEVDVVNSIGLYDSAVGITIDSNDNIYVVGYQDKYAVVRRGKLTSNSASLGPRMLATSIGYVSGEVSGTTYEQFKLNNVSEFPHSHGFYQMPNIILGTRSQGKVGLREEDLIQVRHIGSVVKVFWPKQGDVTSLIKGYGDFAAGQRPGKLTTAFQPGDFYEVTEFDHLALYCQLTKEASGTLDDVAIKIERRPLRESGFSTEQTIDYTVSGSYTEARLRDLIYKKEVNYGDLSIKEIAYPIDIPLTNVKEIRISAKQMNGQSNENNKNLLVFGRLIKSDEET